MLTEDFTTIFNTEDFAVSATYSPEFSAEVTFSGILDKEFVVVNDIESAKPVLYCESSKIPNTIHGGRIVISSTPYNVVGIENDNTGVTKLILEEQDI